MINERVCSIEKNEHLFVFQCFLFCVPSIGWYKRKYKRFKMSFQKAVETRRTVREEKWKINSS